MTHTHHHHLHHLCMKTVVVATLQLAMCVNVAAQTHPSTSTVCNPDGTVTFLYKNGNAKKVEIDVHYVK